jgi:hypothetical protein
MADLDLSPAQRAVLLTGLPIAASEPPPSVSPEKLGALVGWATAERLVGLLAHALDGDDLVVDGTGTDVVMERLRQAHLSGMRSSLAAEATGLAAIEALRAAGVEPFVFKGIATAHLDYDDPSQRPFFDADLLVPRPDLPRAIDALSVAGFRRNGPSIGRRWEHRFARAVELRFRDGVELDLHASLATGYFGQVLDHDLVRTDVIDVSLGGIGFRAFGPTARLLISCYAIVLSRGPNLRLYADLVRQLAVTGSDWRLAAHWAGAGECVIAGALRRAGMLLDLSHPAIEWAQDVVPLATPQRALDLAQVAETDGWSADARSALLALGLVDRARFMAGIAESRLRRRWR